MAQDALHAPADPSHALGLVRPDPSTTILVPSESAKRACLSCGRPLRNRRPEALCCGGPCRAALARRRRREDLVARVHRAEAALTEAAEAVAHLKELTKLDATLELGPAS